MRIVGVDPGVQGAFALLTCTPDQPADLFILPMPRLQIRVGKTQRPRVDLHGCITAGRALALDPIDFAILEDVQGFGGQNAAASFVFGRATCAAEMALIAAECPLRYVQPSKWKRGLGISTEKENAVLEAIRLFPAHADLFRQRRGELTKEQSIGNAEAALLAYYGATRLMGNDNAND